MNEKATLRINHKPFMLYFLVFFTISILVLWQDINNVIYLLVIISSTISFAPNFKQIALEENVLVLKKWFKNEIRLHSTDINSIKLDLSESKPFIKINAKVNGCQYYYNVDADRYLFQNNKKIIEIFQNFSEVNKIPFSQTKDVYVLKDQVSKTFILVISVILVISSVMLYIELSLIATLHFHTMDFMLPRIVIILVCCMACVLLAKMHNIKNAYTDGLLLGILLGGFIGSATKSYIHWYDENNVTNVQYYKMKLDGFDKEKNGQRWIVSDKALIHIREYTFYLHNKRAESLMSNKLTNEKTYLIPIAIGKFNDVFIPKDAFLNPEEVKE